MSSSFSSVKAHVDLGLKIIPGPGKVQWSLRQLPLKCAPLWLQFWKEESVIVFEEHTSKLLNEERFFLRQSGKLIFPLSTHNYMLRNSVSIKFKRLYFFFTALALCACVCVKER